MHCTPQYFTNVQWGEFLWYRLLAPFIPVCNQYIWSDLCLAGLNIMLFGYVCAWQLLKEHMSFVGIRNQ
jgi:hypothetical protein